MSKEYPYLTSKQQNLFEQQLLDSSDGLSIRIIHHRSGHSHLRRLRCMLSSSLLISNQRSKWIYRLFRVSSKSKDVLEPRRQFSMNTGVRNTDSMISDTPWLSSSSESESDEKQLIIDRGSHALKIKYDDDRCIFPPNMTFPQYMMRECMDPQSRMGGFDDMNPVLLMWGGCRKKIIGQMALRDILCVQKGKVTPIAKLSRHPSSHILSVIAKPTNSLTRNETLDIETPTELDRDKFALAFANFCRVPMEDDPLHIL